MKPVTPETRPEARAVIFAKDQPPYLPLPANVRRPYIETKWQLSWKERFEVLWYGSVYLQVKTFGDPLQPVRLTSKRDACL